MLDHELSLSVIYKEEKESILFNQLTQFYKTHFKESVLAMGHGIIINSEGNLSPNIIDNTSNTKNKTIRFEVGSFLDKKGRIVTVSKNLNQSFNINKFYGKVVFFYLKSVEVLGEKIEHPGGFMIQDTVFKGELLLSTEKKSSNSEYIELCRIDIDGDRLRHPLNPFKPQKNELDIRFVPRVLSNSSLSVESIDSIYMYLFNYACFFTELAPRIKAFTTSLVAADAYQLATKVKLDNFSTFEIYSLLHQLVRVTLFFYDEVKDKVENIENSDFRRSLNRLESIFFSEESLDEGTVKFYELNLEERQDKKNFWENIFAHIEDISYSKDPWNLIVVREEVLSVSKDYLLVGRLGGENLDIEIDHDFISGNHLKITRNDINPKLVDIEDLGSSNGTYFHGIRYEEYKKVTINENEKIELHDYEFDIYNNKIVQDFLVNFKG